MFAIFVGWVWGTRAATEELLTGAGPSYATIAQIWAFMIKFLCPVIIVLVLLNLTAVFG